MSHPPFQASVTEAMKAWTTSPSSLVPASRRRMSSAFLSGAPSRYHAVASFLLVETTRKGLQMVAVGTPVTRRPPHRSPHARLTHEALALGSGVKAAVGPGVHDARPR